MSEILIELKDVNLMFPLSFSTLLTAKSKATVTAKRWLAGNFSPREIQKFHALNDINLTISHGEIVGVIGPNGCGKTTLLRIIAGIYSPDSGMVKTSGRISTLLSLGTGFNNNLSGLMNIYMAGHLMGMDKGVMEGKLNKIIEYAELDDYINVPVKYYSNGMISRLGFAIATSMEPEILLVDEVFSVGDLAFRKKSEKTLQDLFEKANVQLIVTHDLAFVEKKCHRAIYMHDSKIIAEGDPKEIVSLYREAMSDTSKKRHKFGSRFVMMKKE